MTKSHNIRLIKLNLSGREEEWALLWSIRWRLRGGRRQQRRCSSREFVRRPHRHLRGLLVAGGDLINAEFNILFNFPCSSLDFRAASNQESGLGDFGDS